MRDAIDYYEILHVPPDAEPAVITAAFRRLALQYHPDVNPDPSAHERMRELNEAFEVLSNPGKRARYDRERRWSGFGVPPPFTPPTFIPPAPPAIGVWERLRELGVARLAIAGAVGLTIVTTAVLATQFGSESGAGGQTTLQSVERAGLGLSPNSVRAEGVYPQASAPARPGEAPVDTPGTTRGESDGTPSPTGDAPAQEGAPSRPGSEAPGVAGPASPPNASSTGATATPKPASPAPKPPTPTSGPPTAAPPAPTPGQQTATPPPALCAAAGTPSWNDNGGQVRFWYGTVDWFYPGEPGLLIVHVAGTVLKFLITQDTDVIGDLSTATVVTGRGYGSPEIDIDATQIEVVCPE